MCANIPAGAPVLRWKHGWSFPALGDDSSVVPRSELQRVPWASLHGTHGSAEDVLSLITALRSTEPTAAEALIRLSDAVVHQGTRWQVSAHVVPFLVRLIDDSGTPNRPALTNLLREVGLGARDDRDLPFDPGLTFGAPTVTRLQEDMVIRYVYYGEHGLTENAVSIADACAEKWAADAYRAVAAHVDTYRRWLDDEPPVASQAAELLAWFAATEPTIAGLLSADRGDAVRASANLALAHLPVPPDAVMAKMMSMLDHGSLAVRTTAAIALAYRCGQDLPPAALNTLIDANDRETLPDFPLGWHRRAARGYVALALQRLGIT